MNVTLFRAKPKASLGFRLKQLWEPRIPDHRFGFDYWRIVAITDHPTCPVVAQSASGATRAFGLNGYMDGEGEPTPLDLVTKIEDAPSQSISWEEADSGELK